MTAALRRRAHPVPIPRAAFLLGSIMPDIPFWLLSIFGGLYFRYVLGWESDVAARHMFDTLYFHDPAGFRVQCAAFTNALADRTGVALAFAATYRDHPALAVLVLQCCHVAFGGGYFDTP